MKNSKLVVIVGETASGKSALALELAKQFDGEVISADAMQVYTGFNIGTAKPDSAQLARIPHHLIDVADPKTGFSAATYKDLALSSIAGVAGRGKLPILVGGTGLYVDAVMYNFSFLPAGDPKLRAKLNQSTTNELLVLCEQQGIDITSIDVRNKRRLIRLLETGGARPTQSKLRPNTLIIGLKPTRTQLRKNIEVRTEQMFRAGLKHEVSELADKYGWEVEPMKGIGYREFHDYFEGRQSLGATKRKIIKFTLDLAKRQRTWFKRHQEITWVDEPSKALKLVSEFIHSV